MKKIIIVAKVGTMARRCVMVPMMARRCIATVGTMAWRCVEGVLIESS